MRASKQASKQSKKNVRKCGEWGASQATPFPIVWVQSLQSVRAHLPSAGVISASLQIQKKRQKC